MAKVMSDGPLKIQQLRYVVAAVESGGFKAAADRLHRTQPAISLGIKELESRFGQPLFEKQGQGRLTPFGSQCLPRFRELLAQHDRISRELDDMANQRIGRVELATVPSVAQRYMPAVLNKFLRTHPDVELSLHDGPAELVAEMVQAGSVDFGVGALWAVTPELTYEPLLEDDIGVVCHQSHRFADAQSLVWRDLAGQSMISNGTSRLLLGTPAEGLLSESRLYISDMISILAMLQTGTTYTTLPRLAFEEWDTALRFIPLTEPLITRSVGLITRPNVTLSPVAAHALHLVREQLAVV
jgi:DNA-binding transcriptional LysR family regulator